MAEQRDTEIVLLPIDINADANIRDTQIDPVAIDTNETTTNVRVTQIDLLAMDVNDVANVRVTEIVFLGIHDRGGGVFREMITPMTNN